MELKLPMVNELEAEVLAKTHVNSFMEMCRCNSRQECLLAANKMAGVVDTLVKFFTPTPEEQAQIEAEQAAAAANQQAQAANQQAQAANQQAQAANQQAPAADPIAEAEKSPDFLKMLAGAAI